jgi:hypothetical protein
MKMLARIKQRLHGYTSVESICTFYKLWCTIADVKITSPDDPEGDVKEIRELLDGSVE